MRTIPLAEAKNRLSSLIQYVESGEDVAITRRGQIVARLVPPDGLAKTARQEDVANIFRELRALSTGAHLEGDLKSIAREGLD
jgi:prevent-host-death family protein